jgi:3-hydroxybutyryl-CoA dehydrogenase
VKPLTQNDCVAVVGAGTMGEGIAQVAATAGHPVLLLDMRVGAAEAALERISKRLDRQVLKGVLGEDDCRAIVERIGIATGVAALAPARLVIEAIVEDLAIKQRLFIELERVVASDAILATNTSSISITAIAGALERPSRFLGLHFFNPAPVMALVEVISGLSTESGLAAALAQLMRDWAKTPVLAQSTPGFILNRIARPYYGEALRLLQEQAADPATLDSIMTSVGGYRMGPFALMDMIGHDVNFAVTLSMFDACYGDPRYQPSIIQRALVDAGRLGRKTGHGFYDHREGAPVARAISHRSAMAPPGRLQAQVGVEPELALLIENAGIPIDQAGGAAGALSWDGVRLCRTDGRSATDRMAAEAGAPLVLYDLVPDWKAANAVAICKADQCPAGTLDRAAALFATLGKSVHVIADRPGMMVARTVAMMVSEAADMVLHGIASARDIDCAMQMGANHPFGPLEIGDRLGTAWTVGVLDNLARAYGENRYRASSLLRQMSASGQTFHGVKA